jgi:hypothetical protein
MCRKYFSLFCGLICSFCLSGCNRYSVSLNDKVVYMPPGLFKNYQLADSQLATCVKQTIVDKAITRAEDLIQLNCSNAGIRSLVGLSQFFALKELNLADNLLTDISEIQYLGRLEILFLHNNQINNTEPLLRLLHLKELNVEKNPNLNCSSLNQLLKNYEDQPLVAKKPTHC